MKWLNLSARTKKTDDPSKPASPRGIRRWLRWPKISVDMADPRQRLKAFLALGILAVLGIGLLIGGVQGYEYTERSEFCGTVCHSMDPQWVRFQASPHGNVRCAECHIGPGANFFVKSKIDGLRQVAAETFDTYHRPIKSPVKNLRPARETCETCHSPSNFKDNIVKTILHFENDRDNTPVQSTLILKMGGGNQEDGISQGIHWHINSEVYYIAADDQRQVMLWVGVKQPDGSIKDYFSRDMSVISDTAFVEQAWMDGRVRRMDCIDCHNRTAHYIPYPEQAVDRAIAEGRISRELPFIRAKAVELLKRTYASQEDAFTEIEKLRDSYRVAAAASSAPASDLDLKADAAVEAIKRIYVETNFPDMNLNWATNPNNERHTPFVGCFRCHDGKHVSIGEDGSEEAVRVKCNLCHTVPIVGRGDDLLIEAPVIVGNVPSTHADFRWTTEHRNVSEAGKQACLNCHGGGFCNNGACHNLSHPEDMLFTHPQEYREQGNQVCYTCHQNILCTRCHPAGIFPNP
ncbi:MAG: NapC/NirT family cytochrome c [Chloroflexi bacterium]|nr:NapC/NirT family cytochrome c [Chloroflexota bacterium]